METTILEKVTVCNAMGLHARPAAQLVHIAGKFQSSVALRKIGGAWADCRSVLALLMLAASCGTELEIQATGCDAREALDAIGAYFKEKFGEN
ncbi:MAG: HPr family phosphocarrier protein [Lentisphaeria bacterium]|nr:HPr family phosphocarrier protein [Lentisphaeria bacterium]